MDARGAPKYVLDAVFTGVLDEVVVLAAGPISSTKQSLAPRRAQAQQLLHLELHANLLPPTTRLQRNGAATHTGGAVVAAPNNACAVHRFEVAPMLEPRVLKKIILLHCWQRMPRWWRGATESQVAVALSCKEVRHCVDLYTLDVKG